MYRNVVIDNRPLSAHTRKTSCRNNNEKKKKPLNPLKSLSRKFRAILCHVWYIALDATRKKASADAPTVRAPRSAVGLRLCRVIRFDVLQNQFAFVGGQPVGLGACERVCP